MTILFDFFLLAFCVLWNHTLMRSFVSSLVLWGCSNSNGAQNIIITNRVLRLPKICYIHIYKRIFPCSLQSDFAQICVTTWAWCICVEIHVSVVSILDIILYVLVFTISNFILYYAAPELNISSFIFPYQKKKRKCSSYTF